MHRWSRCLGSLAATQGMDGGSSRFAREGTAAHTLGERALQYASGNPVRKAEFWIGETITVEGEDFVVDQEMADFVQVYVDQVMREPGELIIEEKLSLDDVYGVENQFGTGDAVVLDHENNRLYVGDLKYGRGVQVYAKDNEQLYSYGAAALRQFDFVGDWQTITVAIHQPRLHHYDEHTLTRDELEEFITKAAERAQKAVSLIGTDAAAIEEAKTAGEKQCQWCPLKGNCATLAAWTHNQVFEDFTTLSADCEQPREAAGLTDELIGKLLARADIIESTVKEWRAETLRRVEADIHVPGWKLVQGRAGARRWTDEDEVEAVYKRARIKQADKYAPPKLKTPTQAEKAFKKAKPKIWNELQLLVEQPEGKPSLAPESDKRPALVVAETENFEDVSGIDDLL
tara:strand:- start:17975 stop:19177 length:1203 start_codon:yes stop_codon:yes gene_type:complete